MQGQTITITLDATDDIGVAYTTLLIHGQPLATLFAPPWQFSYTISAAATSLTIGATVTDYLLNTGTAPSLTFGVIPDPLTTVMGRVVDTSVIPVPGVAVTAQNRQTTSAADGTFTLAGLSALPQVHAGRGTALATSPKCAISQASRSSPIAGFNGNDATFLNRRCWHRRFHAADPDSESPAGPFRRHFQAAGSHHSDEARPEGLLNGYILNLCGVDGAARTRKEPCLQGQLIVVESQGDETPLSDAAFAVSQPFSTRAFRFEFAVSINLRPLISDLGGHSPRSCDKGLCTQPGQASPGDGFSGIGVPGTNANLPESQRNTSATMTSCTANRCQSAGG